MGVAVVRSSGGDWLTRNSKCNCHLTVTVCVCACSWPVYEANTHASEQGSFPPNMLTFDLQLVKGVPPTCVVLKGLCDTERDGQREVGLECVVATLGVASMDATQGVL